MARCNCCGRKEEKCDCSPGFCWHYFVKANVHICPKHCPSGSCSFVQLTDSDGNVLGHE